MSEGIPRLLLVKDCWQCRYGGENDGSGRDGWCYEECRRIPNMTDIPAWCPLPVAGNNGGET